MSIRVEKFKPIIEWKKNFQKQDYAKYISSFMKMNNFLIAPKKKT